jgi:glycosyltransferase involved in cell wall biosynthesis
MSSKTALLFLWGGGYLYGVKSCLMRPGVLRWDNQGERERDIRDSARKGELEREGGARASMNKSSQHKLVSVIIPARDEVSLIGGLVSGIKKSLSEYPHEVTVVDDGSVDGTGEVAARSGAIVVTHEKNQGKGAAMKSGVEVSKGDIIVFLDGDGAHNPKDIPQIIAPIIKGEAEFIIGSRALPGSEVSISPFTRRLSNSLASLVISGIISFLLPLVTLFRRPLKYIKITDCTSGFRAIKKESWQKLSLISDGFQVETEMIFEAARNGLSITEVPISCNWDKKLSRLSVLQDGLKTLKLLLVKLVDSVGGR